MFEDNDKEKEKNNNNIFNNIVLNIGNTSYLIKNRRII